MRSIAKRMVFYASVNVASETTSNTMAHTSLMEIMCRNRVILYRNVGSSSGLTAPRLKIVNYT